MREIKFRAWEIQRKYKVGYIGAAAIIQLLNSPSGVPGKSVGDLLELAEQGRICVKPMQDGFERAITIIHRQGWVKVEPQVKPEGK
jgi:hypothetical protein